MFASFYTSVGSILAPMLPTNELFLAIQNKDPNMVQFWLLLTHLLHYSLM